MTDPIVTELADVAEAHFLPIIDALTKALERIRAAAHKDSLTPAERLQDIRIILSAVGNVGMKS